MFSNWCKFSVLGKYLTKKLLCFIEIANLITENLVKILMQLNAKYAECLKTSAP